MKAVTRIFPAFMCAPPQRRRYLFVDDSRELRELVPGFLRTLTPEAVILVAEDAPRAREVLALETDGAGLVVISDHDLGIGANGLELLAEVGRRHPLAKRVLLTGRDLSELPPSDPPPDVILRKDAGLNGLRGYIARS